MMAFTFQHRLAGLDAVTIRARQAQAREELVEDLVEISPLREILPRIASALERIASQLERQDPIVREAAEMIKRRLSEKATS